MMNYHMHYVLMGFVNVEGFDYTYPTMIDGFLPNHAFSEEQFYTIPGFGFQLTNPMPASGNNEHSKCELQTLFTEDQEVFEVTEMNETLKIGIPCGEYPQTYALVYKALTERQLDSKLN